MPPRFPLDILFRVVPEALLSISSLNSGAFMKCMSHLFEMPVAPIRIAATSTTVRQRCPIAGIRQALPSGAGILATRTSPSLSSVQFNRSNCSSFKNRDDLLRKTPSPISASWRRRLAPSGSWSLLSTQSPSVNSPSLPIRSLMVAVAHHLGNSVTRYFPQNIVYTQYLRQQLFLLVGLIDRT